jgi:hypothetical protein
MTLASSSSSSSSGAWKTYLPSAVSNCCHLQCCCNIPAVVRTPCCCLQLPVTNVRPPVEDSTGYTGVAAPKRKRVEEEPTLDQAPPKVCLMQHMCVAVAVVRTDASCNAL